MLPNIRQPQNKFWDSVSLAKDFKDPFYLNNLNKYINLDDFIIEYGCGYGRLLNTLYINDYHNIRGFDFSKGMIERGNKQFPELSLQCITHADLPLNDGCVDVAILSTVLCCVPDSESQVEIISEIERVLKPNGVLYLADFLITETDNMIKKYEQVSDRYKVWGIYCTSEGALVRHHAKSHIEKLLNNFTVLWYSEEDFVTMNNNAVSTFHGIYRKIIK